MTPTLLCAGAEVALNRYLRLEAAVADRCTALQGRSIDLHLQGPEWTCRIEFMPGGVRVVPDPEGEANVSLRGTPIKLAQAIRQQMNDNAPAISASGLRIEGDAELLQRFGQMMQQVGFEPEEWLAPLVGGPAAHRIIQGVKGLLSWGQRSGERLGLDTVEYFREETRDVARHSDAEEWTRGIEKLRERLDRSEARLQRLEWAVRGE
ncbi:MAG: ubiquinone biosynthesis accessory factor UbiJ [Panacagrimonas sp.]